MIRRPTAATLCVTLLCATLLAAGCSSPPARLYTLSATAVPIANASKISIAVGPVSVPSAVDRLEFVVTTGPNQVQLDEFNRWAAPLENSIPRVVVADLVALLGTPNVSLFPQTLNAGADYRVVIEVQKFESVPGDSISFDAAWSVRRTQDGKTELGRTTLREPAAQQGFDAVAAAHSRAIARMAQDIAESVRALEHAAP